MRTRNQHSGKRPLRGALLPHTQSSVSPLQRIIANSFQKNGEMVRFNGNSLKLSILMPVFNEARTIATVVERVQAVPIDQEIVLVDDASFDGTARIVDRLASRGVSVLHHATNQGKGAAVRTALAAATGDLIVIQDADFEYDPHDFIRMMAPIAAGQAEVVCGVRSLESQHPIMRFGNWLVTAAANLLYGQHLQDIETCYKMTWREIALHLELECCRFDIEAEIIAKLLRSGYAIHEVPIRYAARYDKKKLSPWDGLPTLRALWKYRHWKPSQRGQVTTKMIAHELERTQNF